MALISPELCGYIAAASSTRSGYTSTPSRSRHTVNCALKSISGVKESAWTPIKYPDAIWDEGKARLISYAQVAEFPSPTFTSITARLIVRRVQ